MLYTPFSASRQAQLCEKCDHILDFDENCGVYRFCWLYLYVLQLFPSHFTRRMLYSPFSASRLAQLCAKCDHLLDFDENCGLYRYCWLCLYVLTLCPLHFTRRMLYTPFAASRQTQLCAKCEHIHDFDENCGLYRFCCLYLYVLTLFPLHFTRRMLYTPFSASRQAQLCEKCDHLLDFEEN